MSFSPTGSTIDIGLDATADTLVLSVANSGPPLPQSMRSSIFDSLVSLRGDGHGHGHLGLGLYIVALIAEFHDAKVIAEDLPESAGARFTVEFPRSR